MQEFDVIVIGAGPAGCSAALYSAKFGLKTLLLEEHKTIGKPVHCGECLSELAIQRLGMNFPKEVISKEVNGVRVIFPGKKSFYVKEKGFVLEKHKFEQWIAGEAEKNGAQKRLNSKVTDAVRQNNFWKVKCSDKTEFNAKILIDATGSASFLSAKLNLNKRFESVIGMQYELKDIPETGYLDFFLWPKLAPDGYLWMIPKSGGRANVGLVTNQKNKAKFFLDEFIKEMKWENKIVVKTFGGLIPCSGPMQKTFDSGLILVGDAAGFTSPMFEGGTSLGLTSGKFAAQVVKKAVEKNDFSKETLSEYERLWKKEFPDYSEILKGRTALYDFSDKELDFIAGFLPENVGEVSAIEKITMVLRLLIQKPGFIFKGIIPATKAFGYSQAKHYGW
ncbi:MAG: NAD(P)/FAD-dependent oxidoreductase [archaeon]